MKLNRTQRVDFQAFDNFGRDTKCKNVIPNNALCFAFGAEGEGFEPPKSFPLPVFKTGAISQALPPLQIRFSVKKRRSNLYGLSHKLTAENSYLIKDIFRVLTLCPARN